MTEHGWLNLDKPLGLSSAKAVGQVRKLLQLRKAGHAGTLDPLATGVLPIAFGEATKTVPYVSRGHKEYRFSVAWGESRDTDDAAGNVIATTENRPSLAAIERELHTFVGTIQQRPPIYSAVHVAGRRAYDRARAGESVSLPARTVTVHSLHLLPGSDSQESDFELACGSGVYVRAIARDLGARLGCLGFVTKLRRTRVGSFVASDTCTLDKLKLITNIEFRRTALLPVATGLADLPAITVTTVEARSLRRGQSIHSTACLLPSGITAWAMWQSVPIAIGVVKSGRFSPSRVFNLPEGQQE